METNDYIINPIYILLVSVIAALLASWCRRMASQSPCFRNPFMRTPGGWILAWTHTTLSLLATGLAVSNVWTENLRCQGCWVVLVCACGLMALNMYNGGDTIGEALVVLDAKYQKKAGGNG